MAIGRLSMKVGKAGKAAPHAAYITRQGPYAVRLDKAEKLEAAESGNLPAWARSNPLAFWQAADAYERANGTTYREMEIALPRELDAGHRAALVRAFVRQEIGERHAYQWAIHAPTAADGGEQPHVHLMFSERQVDGIERDPEQYFRRYNAKAPEKGGARKGYGPNAGQMKRADRIAELKALRSRWQDLCNAHLEQAGVAARIDLRSHAERGTGLEPERKQLPSQWRGQGRDSVIAFRQARAELAEARQDLARAVPDAHAEVIHLEAERAERARQATRTPEQRLRDFLAGPPIGPGEGLPPSRTLGNLQAGLQIAPQDPLAWLSEAEQTRLRQHGLATADNRLTETGRNVFGAYTAQQQTAQAIAAEQERARQAESERLAEARRQEREQEQERRQTEQEARLDAATAATQDDSLRAPSAWTFWRAHVLTSAYGQQLAAELSKDWRVQTATTNQPLTVWGWNGQSIADLGDRICPRGAPEYGQPLADKTIITALRMAEKKYGQVDIVGSSEFRERAARQAVRLGITVTNADLAEVIADENAKIAAGNVRPVPPVRTEQVKQPVEQERTRQVEHDGRAAEIQAELERWAEARRQARAERERELSPEPVSKSAPESAQAAPSQARPALPEKQAPHQQEQEQAEREALAYLGERPEDRRRRWDDLQRRVQNPPPNTGRIADRDAAVQAWIADRQKRRLSTDPVAAKAVASRIEQYGWTSERMQKDHLDAMRALKEQIGELERDGKRWWGGNRNTQQIELLQSQQAQRAKAGHAELELARDYETFRPRFAAQEHAQRRDAWQADVQRHQRLAPAAQAILDRDAQEQAEREKALVQPTAKYEQRPRPRSRGRSRSRGMDR